MTVIAENKNISATKIAGAHPLWDFESFRATPEAYETEAAAKFLLAEANLHMALSFLQPVLPRPSELCLTAKQDYFVIHLMYASWMEYKAHPTCIENCILRHLALAHYDELLRALTNFEVELFSVESWAKNKRWRDKTGFYRHTAFRRLLDDVQTRWLPMLQSLTAY